MRMKTWILLVLLAIAMGNVRCLAADDLTQHLQKGLLAEEALRNYEEALKSYQAAVKAYDNNRQAAATAVFRLAETYRKLGRTNEARIYYERVIREFSDQTNLVALSRVQVPAGAIRVAATPNAGPVLTEEDAEVMRLKVVLKDSPDLINGRVGSSGRTPLHESATKGQVQIARFLLQNGAKVNLKADGGYTALHLAAANGHKGMVELLLENGAETDPVVSIGNWKEDDGFTPLHLAARNGFTSVADLLLIKGAGINLRDAHGRTPLHYAAGNDDVEMIRLLVKRHADVNLKISRTPPGSQVSLVGWTPLMLAARNGNVTALGLLIEGGAGAELAGAEGWRALSQAALNNKASAVDFLIASKANPDAKSPEGQTALFSANAEVAKKLLQAGAAPNLRDANGRNPLSIAVSNGDIELVSVLLSFKADPNLSNERSSTALMVAIEMGRLDIVRLLVKSGADLNVQDSVGYSALHYAVANGDLAAVELLLEAGVKADEPAKTGYTPLLLAQRGIKSVIRPAPNEPMPPNGILASQTEVTETGILVGNLPKPFKEIGELLLQKGADQFRGRRKHITATGIRNNRDIRRTVFVRDANGINRFTLFEMIAAVCGDRMNASFGFPDFTRISIERLDGKEIKLITINLLGALETGDCSGDVWLEWGDVVQIPETDHNLYESWPGLSEAHHKTLSDCSRRKVSLLVKDQAYELTLSPAVLRTFSGGPGLSGRAIPSRPLRVSPETSMTTTSFSNCLLASAVFDSKTLLASSDPKRVKVTRTLPGTAEKKVMIYDITTTKGSSNDLWLRDGDVIEVPEKE